MKGAIVYFSGTGNTELVAKEFKNNFSKNNIECDLINIDKNMISCKKYDFFVFGSPIHAEVFPINYIEWVKENIKDSEGKKAIVFSTQASDTGSGTEQLSKILQEKGIKIPIKQLIRMPNNYYLGKFFKEDSEEEIDKMLEHMKNQVLNTVNIFIKNQSCINSVSNFRVSSGKLVYKMFLIYSKKWARKKLTVDYSKCIACGKCTSNCPVKNIKLKDKKIIFENSCISCQRCIHTCPTNAFLYKGHHFKQYKINF